MSTHISTTIKIFHNVVFGAKKKNKASAALKYECELLASILYLIAIFLKYYNYSVTYINNASVLNTLNIFDIKHLREITLLA